MLFYQGLYYLKSIIAEFAMCKKIERAGLNRDPRLHMTLTVGGSLSKNMTDLQVMKIISSPEPKACGELIGWDSCRLPCVH